MQNNEKQLEHALEALSPRVVTIRNSIAQLITKILTEGDNANWPSLLDSYGVITSQLNSLQKLLQNERSEVLKHATFVPICLNPDRDEQLERTTEGRVATFDHSVVPDYLRTKPELQVEERKAALLKRSSSSLDNVNKQITQLNKACNTVLTHIQTQKDKWETESNIRRAIPPSFLPADTTALLAAVTVGHKLGREITKVDTPQSHSSQSHEATRRAGVPSMQQPKTTTIKPIIKTSSNNQFDR